MNSGSIKRFLYNIWPGVYRMINGIFYFLINFFKGLIKMMINQVKHNG